MSGCVWYNVAMAKSHLVLALVAAVILPTEAALKGIVLWPHQARKYPDLSAAISLEYSYALPCDVVSGTNSTGALVCDWSKIDSLLDDIASRGVGCERRNGRQVYWAENKSMSQLRAFSEQQRKHLAELKLTPCKRQAAAIEIDDEFESFPD